ncbi:MAG: sulfotransferase, partial [Hormoscilla sp.]
MNKNITGQIFIVGCPRSGTTLLQSLLGAHPQIASFPESHLFQNLRIRYLSRLLGLANFKGKQQLNWFLEKIGQEQLQQHLPKVPLFISQYVSVFVEALDTATRQQGKSLWVEKSPEHVRFIQLFEHLIPEAKFIHLVRNGADVMASLYDVSRKHQRGDIWGEPWDIDKCIKTWVDSIGFSRRHLHKANHILVRYEQLVAAPTLVLTGLCEFMGIAFDEVMLKDYGAIAQQVVRKDETWKASVGEPIRNANGKKFY